MKLLVLMLCVTAITVFSPAQSITTAQHEKSLANKIRTQQHEIEVLADLVKQLEATVGRLKSCGITINPSSDVVPVKSQASSFSDSPLRLDSNGNLEIGLNPLPDRTNGGLTMVGDLSVSKQLQIHNNYAVGIDLFTHADEEFRAPYMNFYKSRGIQTNPTPLLFTGYELDSMGGINFGGWDGSTYYPSAAIYTQTDENWDANHHGGHISVYATNPAGNNTQQVAQFGGVDPNGDPYVGNIIFQRGLSWGNNASSHPAIFPGGASYPPVLHVRSADNSNDGNLTVGALIEPAIHTPSNAFDVGTTGQITWDQNFVYVCVAPNTWKRSALSAW